MLKVTGRFQFFRQTIALENFWTSGPKPVAIPSFQLISLERIAKFGLGGSFVCFTLLYFGDKYQQHQGRKTFESVFPEGKATLELKIAVGPEAMDTWDYSEKRDLPERYGSGAMVYVGGGKKEGFRGLIPMPEGWKTPIEQRSIRLGPTELAHVGLVIQPLDEKIPPLIIGRQSPLGPFPTLKAAIAAGWQQFANPVQGQTVESVMRLALKTTIANEGPHVAKGTSFDTMIIKDLPIPIEFVQIAIKSAEEDLNPLMTFAWDNCMTTKAYALLKIAKQVDQWAQSGVEGAPTRAQADRFITGCFDIIDGDIHGVGNGILNNEKVMALVRQMEPITRRMGNAGTTPKEPKV